LRATPGGVAPPAAVRSPGDAASLLFQSLGSVAGVAEPLLSGVCRESGYGSGGPAGIWQPLQRDAPGSAGGTPGQDALEDRVQSPVRSGRTGSDGNGQPPEQSQGACGVSRAFGEARGGPPGALPLVAGG